MEKFFLIHGHLLTFVTIFRPYLFLLLIFDVSHIAFSQDNKFKEVVPPSPNAASLGKYGEIPVSYHTGVPQIAIPIYKLTDGDISVPITLNYHSSGVKVEELASWVGLGWSLNAGGVISRTVVGAPDEGNLRGGGLSDINQTGWFKDKGIPASLLTTPCGNNPNYYDASNPCLLRYHDVAKGVADTEPDMFSFNFAGFSGKFFFDNNQQAVLQPKQDIQIIPSSNFSTWTITTPDGTKYSFGGVSATEFNYSGQTFEENISSTSWYLTKIENFNATRSIIFTYAPEKYTYTTRPAHSLHFESSGEPVSSGGGSIPPSQPSPEYAPGYTTLTHVKGLRISQMITSSGLLAVNFLATTLRTDVSMFGSEAANNTEAKRLDQIEIVKPTGVVKFDLGYSYFTSTEASSYPAFGGLTQDLYRLKLDYIQEKSTLESKPAHRFEYEMSAQMARRLSLARDHWGYYNGADANKGLLPSFNVAGQQYTTTTNRTPNEAKMKAWIIKRIFYPTGGKTEFEFEAHRQNATAIVGGLRISKTSTYDGSGMPPMVKNYTYDFGILYAGTPEYKQNTEPYEYPGYIPVGLGIMVSSNIRSSLKTTQGYHIGYSNVFVSDDVNGKSTYRYYNSTPGLDYLYPPKPSEYEIGAGELYQEMHADQNGVIVQATTYYYVTDYTSSLSAKRVVSAMCAEGCSTDGCSGGQGGTLVTYCNQYVLVRNYQINLGRRLLSMKDEYKDGVNTVTHYTYSPHHNNPVKTNFMNSNGIEEVKLFDYAQDRFVSGCTINEGQCYQTYQSAVNNLLQEYKSGVALCEASARQNCDQPTDWTITDCVGSVNTICEGNCIRRKKADCIAVASFRETYLAGISQAQVDYATCRNSNLEDYKNCVIAELTSLNEENRSLAKMIVGNHNALLEQKTTVNGSQVKGTRTIYDFQNDLLVTSEIYEFNQQSQLWTKELSLNFNSQENIREYKKESDHSISYLWGYNNLYPIAKIVNGTTDKVFYTSFEEDGIVDVAKTGRKCWKSAYNVILPAAGVYRLSYWKKTLSSDWEYVQLDNVNSNQSIGGSNISIDEVRLHPKDMQLTTYTYDPGVGVTSITDPNSNSVYYIYDSFGRLRVMKDGKENIFSTYQYNYKN